MGIFSKIKAEFENTKEMKEYIVSLRCGSDTIAFYIKAKTDDAAIDMAHVHLKTITENSENNYKVLQVERIK